MFPVPEPLNPALPWNLPTLTLLILLCGETIGNSLGPRIPTAESPLLGLVGDLEFHWSGKPTFLAQNHMLLMQVVHISGPPEWHSQHTHFLGELDLAQRNTHLRQAPS